MKNNENVTSSTLCVRGRNYIETRIDKTDQVYKYLSRMCVFHPEDLRYDAPQIRSMFVYDTKKENVYSVLVVACTPRRNSKNDIVTNTARYTYKVNIVTNKVWIRLEQKRNSFFVPPSGWREDEWKQSIIMNTKKALGLII
jgi:hypothetical protein